jgi:hypothetical protein
VELLSLTLLGGLLALDGTSVGQFMVSRPLVAGAITGWAVGDPVLGLLIGGILEMYFISVFPVGGAEFPEGGPPTLVAVATGVALPGPAGIALGGLLGFLLSRFGAFSTLLLRRINSRLAPDPSRGEVTPSRIVFGHLSAIGLDFARGSALSIGGLLVGRWLAGWASEAWPIGLPGTLVLLAVGASIPVGAFVGTLGGWRKKGLLFGAGFTGFLIASLVL